MGGIGSMSLKMEKSLLNSLRTGNTMSSWRVRLATARRLLQDSWPLMFAYLSYLVYMRIDQVMTTCLKYLIPISCFLFAGTVAYPLVLAKMSGQTSIIGAPAGERLVKPGAIHGTTSRESNGVSSAGVQVSSASAERSQP